MIPRTVLKGNSMKTKRTSHTILTGLFTVCALALLCNLLWGSAFAFIKVGYRLYGIGAGETWNQVLFAGFRFTLAGVLVVLFGSIADRKPMLPRRQAWPRILCLSMLQTVGQYMFFYIGLARTTGVKAAVLDGSNVFFCLLVASLFFRMEKFTGRKLCGCILGFAGVVLANVVGSSLTWSFSLTGDGFILFSALCYAFSSAALKQFSRTDSPVLLSGWQFIIGGLIMTAAALAFGGRIAIRTPGQVFILLYLACLSAAAYTIWGLLMKHNPVSRIAIFGFCTPVFGVLFSSLLLTEQNALSWATALALVLVAAGIWMVNRVGPSRQPLPAEPEDAPPAQTGGPEPGEAGIE